MTYTVKNSSRISGHLLEMHEKFTSGGEMEAFGGFMTIDESGEKVAVRITTGGVEELLPALEEFGFKLIGSKPDLHFLEGWLPIAALSEVGTLTDHGLLGVIPAYQSVTNVGSVTSQADFVHEADRVRDSLPKGFDGTGVKIGVLSDSYDNLGGAASDITTGDLPAEGVNVLQDLPSGGSDEGRAMLQLIHDLAPGASLSFATASGGETIFEENIKALANEGADIIVDDIAYPSEPFFQDGVIAQAVDEVFDNGVAYFSAAGNESNLAYESTAINFITDTIGGSTGQFYDFDTSAGVDTLQSITIPAGANATLPLQWDDPFYTLDGVDTNLDVFLIDPATGEVVSEGTDDNIAIKTPLEIVGFDNTAEGAQDVELEVAIRLTTGPEPERIKYVSFRDDIIFNEFRTNSPTVNPHAAANGGKAVAAVPFFSQENPEDFTSQGPNTILFDIYGNRLATPEVRQTPDFAAIDATDTTFFDPDVEISGDGNTFNNFFGTSAAAPHAAAIAALIKEANPHFTPEKIYKRLETTAKDIFEPGFDNVTGFGLINAYDAIFGSVKPASLPFEEDFEDGDLPIAFETNSTGAGRIQVTTENDPIGERHVRLDNSQDFTVDDAPDRDESLKELILHVNTIDPVRVLHPFSDLELSFDQKEFDDNDDLMPTTFVGSVEADGVALSVDGTNWFRLFDLTGDNSTNTYQNKSINLSEFAEDNGLTLGKDVQIKFQQFNGGFASPGEDRGDPGGFAFDNISVAYTPDFPFAEILPEIEILS
ncbi:MAG: S8 family serine peptidase [Xenococcus sp. MO_188.B8]|nr:S8 family serine peptidase [Xenococcus sp. MO_188.B8]